MKNFLYVLALVMISHAPAIAANNRIKLLRIAVVDDSSSMMGASIEAVKNELGAVLKQLPASPEFPLLLVTFGDTAQKGRLFTDQAAALSSINSLHGNSGGTDIAAGLAQGVMEIQDYRSVPDMIVLLYTDEGDSNKQGILVQEAKLDAIFSQRRKTNLDQTVVFCQGWQNSALRTAIIKRGNANVVDTAQRLLQPLVITPKIVVKDVTWATNDPTVLNMTIECTAAPDDSKRLRQLSPVRFCCKTMGLVGTREFDVTPNSQAMSKTLSATVPVDYSDSHLDLDFDIALVDARRPGTELEPPSISQPHLTVKAPLPKREVEIVTTTSFDFPSPASWIDPLKLRASYPIILNFDVKKLKNSTVDPAGNVRVIPDADTRIVNGDEVFRLPGTGEYQVPMTLELYPVDAALELHKMRFGFGLKLRPESNNPNIVVTPDELHVEYRKLQPPAPVSTNLELALREIHAVEWMDLRRQIVFIDATLVLSAKGPVPEGVVLSLNSDQCPRLDYRPRTFHTGIQHVRIRLLTKAEPSPTKNHLEIKFQPPKQVGAIIFPATQPLKLQFHCPEPVKLVANVDGQPFEATVADNARQVDFGVVPRLIGLRHQAAGIGMKIDISGKGQGLRIPPISQLPLKRRSTVTTKIDGTVHGSFFRDSRRTGIVEIAASSDTNAVIGVPQKLDIVVLAPFKRLLVLLGVSLSSLAAIILIIRMFVKLRQTD